MIRIFLHLSFLFIFGSILGWILELFFRRIVHKKWVNPGFLKGPYLPIYGIGIVILYIVASVELPIDSKVATYILKTLAIGFLMTAVEYVGGVIFIKKMEVKLWDYSDRLYNYQGLICPLFSAIWTFLGAIYLLFFHTFAINLTYYFSSSTIYAFIFCAFSSLFILDFVNTFRVNLSVFMAPPKSRKKRKNEYIARLHTKFEISEEMLAIYKEEDFKK